MAEAPWLDKWRTRFLAQSIFASGPLRCFKALSRQFVGANRSCPSRMNARGNVSSVNARATMLGFIVAIDAKLISTGELSKAS